MVEPVEGSALPVSGGILAMIPEVDLGIEYVLTPDPGPVRSTGARVLMANAPLGAGCARGLVV